MDDVERFLTDPDSDYSNQQALDLLEGRLTVAQVKAQGYRETLYVPDDVNPFSVFDAFQVGQESGEWFDPDVLEAIDRAVRQETPPDGQTIPIDETNLPEWLKDLFDEVVP